MQNIDLRICGRVESIELRKWADVVVGLLDRYIGRDSLAELVHSNQYVHLVDDTAADTVCAFGTFKAPVMDDLIKILNFTSRIKEGDRVLVHCHAGVSRSTSIAIAILIQHGWNYKDAFDKVAEIRDCLNPNHAFVCLTDEYFGLGGEYKNYVQEWRKNRTEFVPNIHLKKQEVEEMKKLQKILEQYGF